MAVHFSGAYLLGYNQTNNFFGDTLFRYGSTATMTINALIDVRPGGQNSYGYPGEPNSDHLGAKEAFDVINRGVSDIENWQEIKIDYGLGDTVVATGRVVSLASVRQNPVRIGEYTATIEMPISGGEEAFNMQGPSYQQPNNFQNGFAGNTVGKIFQDSGAVFENFSEKFTFSVSEDGSYEYEHSLDMKMLSGEHLAQDPIGTSKEVAKAIFNVAPSDAPAFGFIDEQFSGFYAKTNLDQGGGISGIKYFSEAYDLINLNCSFGKKCTIDSEMKEEYSLGLTHSLTLDDNGIVTVTENGIIKSTLSKSVSDRFSDVRGYLENEIDEAHGRSETFYRKYQESGYVDPDYQGNRGGPTTDNSEDLVSRPIKVGRTYQPNLASAQYTATFKNHQGIYKDDIIHEFTQTVSEDDAGVINVNEAGKLTPYIADGEYANKNINFPALAKAEYDSTFKNNIAERAEKSHGRYNNSDIDGAYRDKQDYTFEELLDEHDPETKNRYEQPTLVATSKQVTVPRYGISVDYSHSYSDDPSLLKDGESLRDAGFRKFSISTNDTFMLPTNSTYTIPALRQLGNKDRPYAKQIVHNGTQTQMGNRSFTINGFIERPSSNVLITPSAWSLTSKLEIVKDIISQKMADIVGDVGLSEKNHDIFVKDVSFSLNSKGEFSAQGTIPFIHLGGVKHDTLGKLMEDK